MSRSVAIIGAGQIGRSAAYEFQFEGYDVTIHSRSRAAWMEPSDRFEAYEAGTRPAPHADVVVDTIAFDEQDVARYDPEKIDRLVVISSASVYCDDQGRTLDEAATNGFPEFDGPIGEEQATVEPGPETYSTRKARMERRATELFGDRATILRPCAIHGPFSKHPREWWFVKRILDGRKRIPLAYSGTSRFHTTSAADIGHFAEVCDRYAWGGIYNVADDNPPSVLEIGKAIREAMNADIEFLCFEGPPIGTVGRTPWSVPKPFVVSLAKAAQEHGVLGEEYGPGLGNPVSDSAKWLCELYPADWRTAFPQLAAYPYDLFDYAAEDAYFASL